MKASIRSSFDSNGRYYILTCEDDKYSYKRFLAREEPKEKHMAYLEMLRSDGHAVLKNEFHKLSKI